jgi:hypothetical protein
MNVKARPIYCCQCALTVQARLTTGKVIYGHRADLHHLPFWLCPACRNFVGCHHQTGDPTRPLGVIPTPEIKLARKHLHGLLDPMWKSKAISRKALYAKLSERLGRPYHTADLTSVVEARLMYRVGIDIRNQLQKAQHADQGRVPQNSSSSSDRRAVDDERRDETPGVPNVRAACTECPPTAAAPST